MEDDFIPTGCCPDEDRIYDRRTRGGLPIVDLHRHRDMVRGIVLVNGSKKVLHWQRGGCLTKAAEHPFDIARRG